MTAPLQSPGTYPPYHPYPTVLSDKFYRYRREGENDDATRQLGEHISGSPERPLLTTLRNVCPGLRSTVPQPFQMGNFRHQPIRDRAERDAIDREKDTASLKSVRRILTRKFPVKVFMHF